MKLIILIFLLNFIKFINAQQKPIAIEYLNQIKSSFVTNLTVLVGETVLLNCSVKTQDLKQKKSFLESSYHLSSLTTFNPTWLKAESIYDQSGDIIEFKNEKIIVSRKGVINEEFKEKLKLVGLNDRIQSLRLNEVNVKDEGKYICREFNSENDKIFYLKVFG
jgi:hypothetical protein